MSIKGGPQQQVNTSLAAIDMAQALVELAKNPKALEEKRQMLIEANTISDERRSEAEAALIQITEAQKSMAVLSETMAQHEENVNKFNTEISQAKSNIQASLDDLTRREEIMNLDTKKQYSVFDQMKSDLSSRDKGMSEKENDLKSREERLRLDTLNIQNREELADEREARLFAAERKLEARKKKLAEAAQDE